MRETSFGKRLLSMLLALAIIIGLGPVVNLSQVFAAETPSGTINSAPKNGETTYVLAGSDFQPTDASNTTGVNLLNKILDKVDDNYTTMDGFLFMGDYDYNYSASQSGKEALQDAVQAVYGTEMDEVYVQGNHDADNLVGSVLAASGAHDTNDYGVYVINEKDYMWYNDDEATIKNTAAALEGYLNAKRNAEYDAPIFVVSHLPLHYCMRTQVGGGDGKHANYIFDVLNEAGAAGLNIIFMFGHNHSHGWDDPYGGAAIFLKKGDSINIAQNSTTVYNVETLNFTYMNAGYVSYYRNVNSGAETDLSMTVFTITDTDVTIERYTADGLHNLKSAGVANTHASTGSNLDGSCSTNHGGNETYSPDTSVVASAYTMTLNTEITPAGTEVETPDSGTTTTQRTYTRVTSTSELVSGGKYLIFYNGSHFMLPEVVEKSDGSVRKGFNIESTSICGPDTITGDYSAKEWTLTSSGSGWLLGNGTQYAKLTNTSDYKVTATLETSGDVFTIGGSENAFTFSNGNYVFNYNDRGLINGYANDAATFYIYRMTNEGSTGATVETSGGNWVTITEPTAAGTKYVYELDTDGIDTGVEYLIVANSYPKALSAAASSNNAVDIEISGNYAYATSDTYGWTFTRYNNGVYYIRLNGSTYLALSNNALGSSNSGSSRRWTVSSNNNGSYDIVRNNYNLRWSNPNGVFQASNSNEGPVRLYKYVRTETTQAQAGLYGMVDGELTYNVEIGTSAADALAKVKAGIDILYHTGDANAAETFPDDGEGMTWTLDPSYDGVTPGEYAVTIKYGETILGVAKVVVPAVKIVGYSVDPMSATVRQGAAQSLQTGSKITVTLENGDYYTVPVTISMLSKNGEAISTAEAATLEGLTVTYNGVVITENYTLTVIEKVRDDYPEYPDEGAVKANKTATGIDFQSSGIAQIELSASGVPAQKGADVVIVIDTSSSMKDNYVGDSGKTRIEVLSESLKQMLEQFQTADGTTGMVPDIDIAIIDFNGYFDSAAGDFDKISFTNSYRDNADYAKIFTGNNEGGYVKNVGLSASDFVEIDTINANTIAGYFTNGNCKSGTNYDGALENAYTLLSAKQAANGEENRDSYVIFLSDGAPFRYNGMNNGSDKDTYNAWSNWLTGSWANADDFAEDYPNNAYSYFYNGNGTNHPHLYAEAIKGTKGDLYSVISRDAADNDSAYMKQVSGLGATIYSIGFGLADDGSDEEGGKVSVATQQELIQVISSGDGYNYPNVQSADELVTAFTQIATAINYAASKARFVDQMGDSYNLQMSVSNYTVVDGTTTTDKTITPKIEIISYDIYTRQDYLNGTITEDKIGDRKGTYTILETVTFNADGTEAYSDQIGGGTTNILADGTQSGYVKGVIYAKTFLYNTNATEVAVEGVSIPTGTKADGTTTGTTNVLPSETFYWKMGTVQTSELAMRYYVYLEGSMEGTKEAGSFATNEFAILYYDNYLGNPCYKDTVSPVVAWKEANVSYAFYLVDADGNIIVNQTTGQTGSFANKIAVTNPVVHETVLLNNDEEVSSIDIASLGVLPEGYTLYDYDGKGGATYTVTINSNTTGSWNITSVKDKATTYVMQYDPNNPAAYSNDLTHNTVGNDYTHTVVWFAVVWKVQALPDSVVVDYGLPVDISVLRNDMFGEKGKLAGVGAYTEGIENITADNALASGFGTSYTGTYGTAKADTATGTVRYTLKDMQMNGYEKFAYAVNYTGNENAGYYYDTVTVIPATSIYYEDDFLTYTGSNTEWVDEGTKIEGAIQDEDRPGKYSLTDANNIYGYDSVNLGMSTYSMGTAKKVTVSSGTYATAEFTFYGTGFDIISMTNSTTGTIVVDIYKDGNNDVNSPNFSYVVDTYYGYDYGLYNVTYTYTDGAWVKTVGQKAADGANEQEVNTSAAGVEGESKTGIEYCWVLTSDNDAMYQVPVITKDGLEYGKYKVIVTAFYNTVFDNTDAGKYTLYLDAVRIYDPANNGAEDDDNVIEEAYQIDGEGWPTYFELRNYLIAAESFGNYNADSNTDGVIDGNDTPVTGLVFIDGKGAVSEISDYVSYGPNNEIYLAPGQRVAFILSLPQNLANVHIGIKSANGEKGAYTITNVAQAEKAVGTNTVKAGTYYAAKTSTIDTNTEMYYDLSGWKNDIIVISNTSNRQDVPTTGIIALTNIKFTYKSNPYASDATGDENSTSAASYRLSAAPTSFSTMATTNELATVSDGAETTVSNVGSVYMTASAAALAVQAVNAMEAPEEPEAPAVPEEPEVFQPEKLEISLDKGKVKEGEKVKVNVRTSDDVAYITVNGETVTRYKTDRRTGDRIWTVQLRAEEAGDMTIEAIAYNEDGLASEAATAIVKVQAKKKSNEDIIRDILDWLFG